MPAHLADDVGIYDTAGIVPDHPLSPPLESERRLFYVAVTRAIKHLYIGTIVPPQAGLQSQSSSPLPSRFIDEMQLEPTRMLITAMQKALPAGLEKVDKLPRADLKRTLSRLAGLRSLLCYVTEHYLSLQDPELVGQVDELVEGVPETRFEYQYEYPALGTLVEKRPKREPDPPPWTDPWKGIGNTR